MEDDDKAEYVEVLRGLSDLKDFLEYAGTIHMFWFFQHRDAFLSQDRLPKWSPDLLNEYVLLPVAHMSVMRSQCYFVSHFWLQPDDPDPDGQYLQVVQDELLQRPWRYVWVDWACLPQHPRTVTETKYFRRALSTMPAIIQEASFISVYTHWEPRLWILFEVAHYMFTDSLFTDSLSGQLVASPIIDQYIEHIAQMLTTRNVKAVLDRYGYRCKYSSDQALITFWLELLVLFAWNGLDKEDVRSFMTTLTYHSETRQFTYSSAHASIRVEQFDGLLVCNGIEYELTPRPSLTLATPNV